MGLGSFLFQRRHKVGAQAADLRSALEQRCWHMVVDIAEQFGVETAWLPDKLNHVNQFNSLLRNQQFSEVLAAHFVHR